MIQLRCKVCQATQAVSCADEADEDLRSQSIRRVFRAEHVASCGTSSVSLEFPQGVNGSVDVDGLFDWAKKMDRPADVTPTQDGYFTRRLVRDGVPQDVRVCEGCWQNIPRYVDFPYGLVSPESDGDAAKTRRISMETNTASAGVEHLRKAVCLPCYLAAFSRQYPDAALPVLSADVIGDGTPVASPVPPEELSVGDPTKAMVA